jgi:cytochrome P450
VEHDGDVTRRARGELTTTLPRLDLSSPRLHAERDLTEYFAALRAESACARHETPSGRDYYVVPRHADVAALLGDPNALSSSGGNVMDTALGDGDTGADRMLALMDGPRHLDLRRILRVFFTKGALSELAPRLRSLAAQLLDRRVDGEPFDFAADVAAPLPIMAVSDLLGVPAEDRQMLVTWTSKALGSDDENYSAATARLVKSELLLYFYKLAETKRHSPGRDLVTTLVNSHVGGDSLGIEDVILNCYSLLLGGDQTTRLAMISAVDAFAHQPETWDAVRLATDLGPVVEEVLRWTTPALHVARTVVRPLTVGATALAPGDVVVLWTASANYDERVFGDPVRFDPARKHNPHLTFASGAHFCLGAQLARLELTCFVDVLRQRVASLAAADEPRRLYSNFLSGYATLPIIARST